MGDYAEHSCGAEVHSRFMRKQYNIDGFGKLL